MTLYFNMAFVINFYEVYVFKNNLIIMILDGVAMLTVEGHMFIVWVKLLPCLLLFGFISNIQNV